jgi:outer membrane protein TolC
MKHFRPFCWQIRNSNLPFWSPDYRFASYPITLLVLTLALSHCSQAIAGGVGIMPTTQPDLSVGPGASIGVPLGSPNASIKGSSSPLSILRPPIDLGIKPHKWRAEGAPVASIVTPQNTTLLKSEIVENNQSLSVVDALDEALLNSPRAAAIRANLGIARSNFAYATVLRNPYFFFDRGLIAEAERRIGPTFTWTPPWQTAFDLLVAKRQVDQAKLEILRDLWGLRADVRRAYTDAVIAQETATATENLVTLANQTLEVTRRKFQAGGAPEFDALKAQLALEQAELDLKQVRQRVIKTHQHLNLLLGRMPKQPLKIPSLESAKTGTKDKRNYFLPNLNEDVADLDVFIEQAKKSRWELTVIGQQIKVNKANLKNSYSNIIPIPQLILGQSVSGNQPTGPKLNADFFTVNAEMPFTNFQQGDIAKFKAMGKQLGWQLESQKNQVYTEIADAYNDLVTFRDRIRLYQEHVLFDSEEAARLSRRSYQVGFTDITGVIQAQQANFQIQLQYLADVQSYQQAFIALEQSVGRPIQ